MSLPFLSPRKVNTRVYFPFCNVLPCRHVSGNSPGSSVHNLPLLSSSPRRPHSKGHLSCPPRCAGGICRPSLPNAVPPVGSASCTYCSTILLYSSAFTPDVSTKPLLFLTHCRKSIFGTILELVQWTSIIDEYILPQLHFAQAQSSTSTCAFFINCCSANVCASEWELEVTRRRGR